jgi:hypothetical protein
VVYRIDLAAPATLDAFVVDRAPMRVQLAVIAGGAASACQPSGAREVIVTVPAGPVDIVVAPSPSTPDGEYAIVVHAI